ncbi:hypothetical protein [Lentzea sp. NBRC 105346]|uniref:hypothetical protein n=1 Tax=Lentzea sp. NBRC 105346 TaxID=3032205 RepID=UPI002555EBC1|nr:hypothetical protein [Lentzea sp. NBRC 105346]
MTPELSDLAQTWERFVLGLRRRDGLDADALNALKEALGACAAAWAGRDSIPRLGANILVDIVPATDSNSHLYEGEVQQQIIEVMYELQDLVWDCVAIHEPFK